jgi:hypothetical protein
VEKALDSYKQDVLTHKAGAREALEDFKQHRIKIVQDIKAVRVQAYVLLCFEFVSNVPVAYQYVPVCENWFANWQRDTSIQARQTARLNAYVPSCVLYCSHECQC